MKFVVSGVNTEDISQPALSFKPDQSFQCLLFKESQKTNRMGFTDNLAILLKKCL